jgi:hypothetical protein
MWVKMLKSVGSSKGVHNPGDKVELDDAMAKAWIEADLAEEMEKSNKSPLTAKGLTVDKARALKIDKKEKPAHETKMIVPEENKDEPDQTGDEKPEEDKKPEEKPVEKKTTGRSSTKKKTDEDAE